MKENKGLLVFRNLGHSVIRNSETPSSISFIPRFMLVASMNCMTPPVLRPFHCTRLSSNFSVCSPAYQCLLVTIPFIVNSKAFHFIFPPSCDSTLCFLAYQNLRTPAGVGFLACTGTAVRGSMAQLMALHGLWTINVETLRATLTPLLCDLGRCSYWRSEVCQNAGYEFYWESVQTTRTKSNLCLHPPLHFVLYIHVFMSALLMYRRE